MNPEEIQKIIDSKIKEATDPLLRKIETLERWKEEKTRQQLSLPLDVASVGVLRNAFENNTFPIFKVIDIFFQAQSTGTTVSGQFRYFDDGVNQNFRAKAGTFNGTVDLTAA